MYPINYLTLCITVSFFNAEGNGAHSTLYDLSKSAKVWLYAMYACCSSFSERHTSSCSLFYHSQLPCLHLQSSQMCTQSDGVIADSSFHLFSQLILDTVHKPLPPHHFITWQMTLNTLARCSWAALHFCPSRSHMRPYTHIIALVLLSSQFCSYETTVNPQRKSKKVSM